MHARFQCFEPQRNAVSPIRFLGIELACSTSMHVTLLLCLPVFSLFAAAQNQVTFPDPQLEAVVRDALSKYSGSITSNDMAGLVFLGNFNALQGTLPIRNLTGLETAVNLESLYLPKSPLTNVTALSMMPRLRELEVSFTGITNILFVSALTQLESLWASGNNVQDASPLIGHPALRRCALNDNPITNISVLTNLPRLGSLKILSVPVSNLDFLRELPVLSSLDFGPCTVTDLSILTNVGLRSLSVRNGSFTNWEIIGELSQLSTLKIWDPSQPLTNLAFCGKLTNLVDLVCSGLATTDIGPLSELHRLQTLELTDMPIADFMPLAGLSRLLTLSLANTGLRDLNWINVLSNLTILTVSSNAVTNWSLTNPVLGALTADSTGLDNLGFLAGLPQLTYLQAAHNHLEDLGPLAALTNLNSVRLPFNRISNVTALLDLPLPYGIDVSYNRIDLNPGTPGRTSLDLLRARRFVAFDGEMFQPHLRLNATRVADEVNVLLQFTVSPKVTYYIERSTNLVEWTGSGYISGDLTFFFLSPITVSITRQPAGPSFYRLRADF
jgi:hypothetical protein